MLGAHRAHHPRLRRGDRALGIVGTFVDLVRQLPGHAAGRRRHRGPGHGRRHLGEEGPPRGCATSRGTSSTSTATSAPAWPCRTSCGPAPTSCPRPTATVFWWSLYARVRRCGARLPGRAAAVALAARTAARARRAGRGPGRHHGTVGGRGVRRMPVRAGQFFQWRFLDGPGWTRATPTRISAAPDGRTLRFTAAHVGDGSAPARDAAPRHPGARRGPLRPAARRGARPPQGAAHGVGHRHHPDARAARGARPGARRRHRRAPGALAARCRARRRARGARRGPRRPLPRSSRAPACRGRDSWLPAQARHLTDVQALREIVPDIADHDVYVCGSDGWMTAARTAAIDAGVPARRRAPRALLLLTSRPDARARNPPCAASPPGC